MVVATKWFIKDHHEIHQNIENTNLNELVIVTFSVRLYR